jgi:hypothetical protein
MAIYLLLGVSLDRGDQWAYLFRPRLVAGGQEPCRKLRIACRSKMRRSSSAMRWWATVLRRVAAVGTAAGQLEQHLDVVQAEAELLGTLDERTMRPASRSYRRYPDSRRGGSGSSPRRS